LPSPTKEEKALRLLHGHRWILMAGNTPPWSPAFSLASPGTAVTSGHKLILMNAAQPDDEIGKQLIAHTGKCAVFFDSGVLGLVVVEEVK
jgi:hypothetical protein